MIHKFDVIVHSPKEEFGMIYSNQFDTIDIEV